MYSDWSGRAQNKDIQWCSRKGSAVTITFSGIPYIIIGKKVMECSFGSLRCTRCKQERSSNAEEVTINRY